MELRKPSKDGLEEAIRRVGGVQNLPPAPDGPTIDIFDPRELSRIIKQEIIRSRANGWPRISIHMSLDDALALARALEVR
jgi:hypothetical protein